jgi:medium-chain acyl-[acyl-carrier-protein] hydrolase
VNPNNHSVSLSGDIFVYDNHHHLVLELTGVNAKIIDTLMERTEEADNASDSVLDAVLAESSDAKRKALIENYLIRLVAEASKASPDQLDTSMTFKNMGIDSLTTVQLRNKIEKQFDVKLVIKLFYQYPSIGEFSNVLVDLLKDHAPQNSLPVAAADKWLTVQKANMNADKLLFLFHDAGGSIRLFENWESHIDNSTEIITIQLPGRDDRAHEPLVNDLNPILEELLPLMNEKIGNKPFFIYGHSMGGLIAFEAARRLQHQYGKHAHELIVSGTPCLKGYENHFVNNIFAQNYTDEQLLSLITSSDSNLDINNNGVKELVKMLRNDFELIHGYRYNDMPALNCKITAIHAKEDDRVDVEKVKLWQSETHHDFSLIVVDGGHNFVYTHSNVAPLLINESILSYKTVNN